MQRLGEGRVSRVATDGLMALVGTGPKGTEYNYSYFSVSFTRTGLSSRWTVETFANNADHASMFVCYIKEPSISYPKKSLLVDANNHYRTLPPSSSLMPTSSYCSARWPRARPMRELSIPPPVSW